MWRRPHRRVDVAASWQRAREQFASLMTENTNLRAELRNAREQRDEALSLLDELRAAVRARHAAGAEVAGLYRERELHRARSARRDPAQPLH
jgi:hypothetical protein